jgi:hypothetical protein
MITKNEYGFGGERARLLLRRNCCRRTAQSGTALARIEKLLKEKEVLWVTTLVPPYKESTGQPVFCFEVVYIVR